jgi:hypothetical protein
MKKHVPIMVLIALGLVRLRPKLIKGNSNTYEQGFYDCLEWTKKEMMAHYENHPAHNKLNVPSKKRGKDV